MFGSEYQLELTRPALLFGLVVLPALVYYFYRSLVDFARGQMIASLLIRSIVVVLLVLALAGLTLLKPTRDLFVVFALDRSLSVGDESRQTADTFIENAGGHAGNHRFAVLPFAAGPESMKDGRDWLAERSATNADEPESPTRRRNESRDAQASAAQECDKEKGTDIAAVLELAAASIPPHYVPRIVLLTDGNETTGDALETVLTGGMPVCPVPLATRDDPEIQVSAVNVPAQVMQGEPFFIEVVVDSNHDDRARIEVFSGPHKVVSEAQEIKEGENRFRFRQSIDRDRLAEYAVRISGAKEDTLLDNNSASGLVFAAGKPRVLLIESAPELARHLEWALGEEDILVDTRPPQGMPDSLADLQNYELLMISNVPATALTSRKMEIIRTYVRDLGGGLVMLGGDQSFGLGGYYKTAIEDVLPVRSNFEKEKEKPSLAMALVIDKSGSMGGEKIELVKEAAKSAVELLGASDYVGVLAFEGDAFWVSEMGSASNKGTVIDRISTLEAGGGTNMAPAMDEAHQALSRTPAKLKHAIILTDGISAPGDFEGIAQAMASARITVSTVGVGEGCDTALLEEIARIGRGRHYFTSDPSSIPQIFAKETMTASKSAINEEPFIPQARLATPVLADIDVEAAPFLYGYVITRPKPTSEVPLITETGDPLLAWWRYGLGMSVAFTSDAKSRWAAEWLTWPGYGKFWAQLVRHAMRKGEAKGFLVEVERNGTRATVRLDSVAPDGSFLNDAETELTLIDPRLSNRKLNMTQTAPGRYIAELDVPDTGAWHLDIAQKHEGQVLYRQSRGLVVGYPDELRLRPTNEILLRALARAAEAPYDPKPDEVFTPPETTAAQVLPLWPYLTMAALVLFVADVALRRIDFSLLLGPFLRRRAEL